MFLPLFHLKVIMAAAELIVVIMLPVVAAGLGLSALMVQVPLGVMEAMAVLLLFLEHQLLMLGAAGLGYMGPLLHTVPEQAAQVVVEMQE